MTIESNVSKNTYIGNGQTTIFPFTYKIWQYDEVKVTLEDEQGITSNIIPFSVTINKNGGGEVVLYLDDENKTPIPTGYTIALTRNMPFKQEQDFLNGGRFNAEVIEDCFDMACAERQQLKEAVERTIQIPPTSGTKPEALLNEIFSARNEAVEKAATATAGAEISTAQANLSQSYAQSSNEQAVLSQEYANTARAWAESEEAPDPNNQESKSAKTWAMIAADILPIATAVLLGKVKGGGNITIDPDGTLRIAQAVLDSITALQNLKIDKSAISNLISSTSKTSVASSYALNELRKQAPTLAMPSDEYIEYPLSLFSILDNTYRYNDTAPANGYILLFVNFSTSSWGQIGSYTGELFTSTHKNILRTGTEGTKYHDVFLPVRKGQKFYVQFGNAQPVSLECKFVYAQGEI